MSRKKKKTLEELLEEALVPEEEQPYQVPDNWVWVRLGALLPEMETRDPTKLGTDFFTYIDVESIDNKNQKVSSPKTLSVKKAPSRAKRAVHEGDVIISLVRPYLKNIAYIGSDLKDAVASTAFYVCGPSKAHCNKYLYYYSKSDVMTTYLNLRAKGHNSPSVRNSDFLNTPFPLPPLPEQKRIVDRVESLLGKINEAKELIEEAKETFETRRAAILAKAFRGELTKKWREQHPDIEPADQLLERIKAEKEKLEETKKRRKQKTELPPIEPPYELPKGWKWVRLGDITTINPGKPKNMEFPQDHQCSFVPMAAIDGFRGIISNIQQRRFDEVKNGYTYFEENDILFAKITPCMENGKVALAKGLINQFGFGTTEFHVIRCNPHIHPKYIYHLVRSDSFRKRAKAAMTGAVGQQRVPKNFLETYPCPLPPFKEQKVIADHLDALLSYEYDFQTILDREDDIMTLTQSILNKAFRGELGTNDPEEESALELLKEVLLEQAGETIDNPKSKANRQGSLLLV